MLGGPADPAAIFGAPDGMTAGWDERFEANAGFEERRLWTLRLRAWRDFADRCGACTVMAGNVAGFAGEVLAGELLGSPKAGPAGSVPDCAWAEAGYKNPGINTAVKTS
jgi:hypothetical protein